MDPATVTASVIGILTPYFVRGAKALVETVGEVAVNKAEKLLEKLKQRLCDDEEASDSLQKFEEKPQRYAPVVEDILTEKIAKQPELGEELQAMVDDLAPSIDIFQKMAEADGVVGVKAGRISRGQVRVTQEIDKAKNVTGAEFDDIG